jgi:acyl-CoA reductase-like NAD-dependent aldehyde dehydrogenase
MTSPDRAPHRSSFMSLPLPQPLDALSDEELSVLDAHVTARRFRAGDCLFREGAPGDGCYLIESGEVRLQLERAEIDSDGVLQVLGPGSLVGELSLLDRLPRSASAYAESDVTTRFFPAEAIETLGEDHPRLGAKVLRAIARDASLKLRATTDRLATFIHGDEPDPLVEEYVRRAAAAQQQFESWSEERVDALLGAIATRLASKARELAVATVEETRLGNADDKALKNVQAALGVYQSVVGRPGVGRIALDAERRVEDYASPAGVIFALVPQTGPVATATFKAIVALKSRNAIILSAHRSALGVTNVVGEIVRATLVEHGAPADLVLWVRERGSRKLTQRFMAHPGVALILATGGSEMVKAAYSSGTPALGVGPGNAPCVVAADADLEAAAQGIVASKAFDNGLICASEHNLVVVEAVREAFVEALVRAGAAVLGAEEVARFRAGALGPDGTTLRPRLIGRAAAAIAEALGIERDYPIRVIVVPADAISADDALSREKLAPVLSLFTATDAGAAVDMARTILRVMGAGHTAALHTRDPDLIARFGREVPASRLIVNSPAVFASCGLTSGLLPSFTLGCGTFGRNSTTDNVSYHNLRNVKRLAHFVPPAPEHPGAAAMRAMQGTS